ncbi:MAG: hypothetical protein KAR38_11100 [Calditrichia bacterium]|nr:hypothetical protein [Calditrichia bacterium]
MSTMVYKYKTAITVTVVDFTMLCLLYVTPAFSHLVSLPIYLFDPMRIFLFLAAGLTNKKNTYFLALTLPIFSFFISGHPFFIKSILIAGELLLNVYLFYLIKEKIGQTYLALGLSILISKILYYFGKFILIKSMLIEGKLITTPFIYQFVVILLVPILFIGVKKFKEKMNW